MGKSARMSWSGWVNRLLVLLLAGAAVAATDSASSPRAGDATSTTRRSPFVAVILRDWQKWDRDGDGILSAAEIDRAVLDPANRGDDAAAAAALKITVRDGKVVLPPLDRGYFDHYESSWESFFSTFVRAARATIRPVLPATQTAAGVASSATFPGAQFPTGTCSI